MKPPCVTCGHVHPSTAAIAVDRFGLNPNGFRANFVGATKRPTRAQAGADWCQHKAEGVSA